MIDNAAKSRRLLVSLATCAMAVVAATPLAGQQGINQRPSTVLRRWPLRFDNLKNLWAEVLNAEAILESNKITSELKEKVRSLHNSQDCDPKDSSGHVRCAATLLQMCFAALKGNGTITEDGTLVENAPLNRPLVHLAQRVADYAKANKRWCHQANKRWSHQADDVEVQKELEKFLLKLKPIRGVPKSKLEKETVVLANTPGRSAVRGQRGSSTQTDTEQTNSLRKDHKSNCQTKELHTLWAEVMKAEAILESDKITFKLKEKFSSFRNGEDQPTHVCRVATLLQTCFVALEGYGIIKKDGTLVKNAPLDCPLVLLAQRVVVYAVAFSAGSSRLTDGVSAENLSVVKLYLGALKPIYGLSVSEFTTTMARLAATPVRLAVPGQRGNTTQADTEQNNSDCELHTLWAEVIKAGDNLRADEDPALTELFPLLTRNKEHVYRAATLLKACFLTLMKNNIITAEGKLVGNAPLDGQLVLFTQHVKGYAQATLKCRAAVCDSRWEQFVVERYLHKLKKVVIGDVPESRLEETTVLTATRRSTTQTHTEQNGSLSPAVVRSIGVRCTLQEGKFNPDTDELRTLWAEIIKVQADLRADEAPVLKQRLFPLLIINNKLGHVYRAETLLEVCFFTLMKNNIITAEGSVDENAPLDRQLALLTQRSMDYAEATLKYLHRAGVCDSPGEQSVMERYLATLKPFREVLESRLKETMSMTDLSATGGSTTQTDTGQNGSPSLADVRLNGVRSTLQDGKFNRDTDELRTLWVEVSKAEAILPPDIDRIIPHFLIHTETDHVSRAATLLRVCLSTLKSITPTGKNVEDAPLDCQFVLFTQRVVDYAKATLKHFLRAPDCDSIKELPVMKRNLVELQRKRGSKERRATRSLHQATIVGRPSDGGASGNRFSTLAAFNVSAAVKTPFNCS